VKHLILRCIRWRGNYLILGKNTAMRILLDKAESQWLDNYATASRHHEI
jgi:hypothetical protein